MTQDGTEGSGELQALVTRDVPQMVIEVADDATITHEGKAYHGKDYGKTPGEDKARSHGEGEGTELTVDGPTAFSLVMSGAAKIVRSA